MQRFITFIFLLSAWCAHSQNDTLVIHKSKYALKKCQPFYDDWQIGPVLLPSEYTVYKNEYMLTYKKASDSTFAVETDAEGNPFIVLKPALLPCVKDPVYENSSKTLHVRSFIDTVRIKGKDFCTLRPYIKTNGRRLHFRASNCQLIQGDTITEVAHENMVDGNIFMFFQDCYYNSASQTNKKATFLLQNMYYVKGTSTFYLNKSFLLIVE